VPLAGLGLAKTKLALLVHLGAIGLAAAVVFLLVAWALRMDELRVCVDAVRPRIRKLLGRLRG